MLCRVRVPEDCQPRLYNQEDLLPPGTYLYYQGYLEKKKAKAMGGRAVSVHGRFQWFFPDALFVRRGLTGYLPPERALYGTEKELIPEMWGDVLSIPFRPWQRQALLDFQAFVRYKKPWRHGHIVSMGGGKTLYGLALAHLFKKPAVLVDRYAWSEWKAQASEWGLTCPTLQTYQSCHKLGFTPDLLIIDEANAVSNDCKRTQKIRALAQQCGCCIGLTGTSISVSPTQIRWANAMVPGLFPDDANTFKHLYGIGTKLVEVTRGSEGMPGRQVWDVEDWDRNLIAQHAADYVTSVDISDLLKDLPPLSYKRIKTKKPQFFDMLLDGAAATTRSKAYAQGCMGSDGHFINEDGLVQELGGDKLEVCKRLIESIGEPVIVVSHWTATQEKLKRVLADFNPASIGDGMDEIEKARFNGGETDVILLPFMAGKSHNLQKRCRIIIFVSNGTSPLMRQQIERRVFRPGQTKGCLIIDLVAEGTLDEVRLDLLQKHQEERESIEAELQNAWAELQKGIKYNGLL